MKKPHKDLRVWAKSIELVREVYSATRGFPVEERFCLTPQMRRAALSVLSNIAEGAARKGTKEYLRFLYTSQASLSELDAQFDVAEALGYVHGQRPEETMEAVDKMLSGLIRSLLRRLSPPDSRLPESRP